MPAAQKFSVNAYDFEQPVREAMTAACRWHRLRPSSGPFVPAVPFILENVEEKLDRHTSQADFSGAELTALATATLAYIDAAYAETDEDFEASSITQQRDLLEEAAGLPARRPDRSAAALLLQFREVLVGQAVAHAETAARIGA